MAINFLNDLDLNQNEAFHFVLENQVNDTAAGTPVDGQLYYDSGTNAVKFGEGGAWVALGTSSASGTVTSVGVAVGTGISVAMNSGSNPITTTGEFLLTNTGVTSIVAGTNVSISGATGAVTISSTNTEYSTATNTTLGLVKLGSNTTLTQTYETGVTGAANRTYPVQLNASSQMAVSVPWTDTTGAVTSVDEKASGTSSGTPIVVDPTTGAVEIQSMAYAGTTNVGHVPTGGSGSTFLRGDGTWVTPTDTDTGITGVTLATGTSVGAPLTESIATRELTLTSMAYDGGTNIGFVPTGGSGSTFLRGDGTWVTPTDTNHTYSLSVGAVGSNESTLTLVGAGGGSDSTAKFSGTTNEIEITTPSTGDGGDITIGLPSAVTITTSLAISGSGAAALDISSGKAQTAATSASDPDATLTTKGYVDGLVSGGLNFKGTFRADTGQIIGGSTYIYQLTGTDFDPSATRVEVEVGDYYVVATAGGDFYGDGGTGTCSPTRPLTVGDSIIGLTAASASASTCANWSIVESNEGVTTFTNVNGTYVSASTVNTGATGAVTVGTLDLSAIDGTATNTVRFLDKNNKWSVPAYTTNTDETYDLNVSDDGDNVDLNLTSTSGTDNSTVQLTAGTNITLTPTGSTEVTIATVSLDNYQSWTLAGDGGTPQTISSTNTATFSGGTKITTTASATDTLSIAHDTQSQTNTTPSSTLSSAGTFTALSANVSVDSTGHVTGQALETYTLPTSDNYSSWTLAGDSGTPQTIASGNTGTIAGGTGISTAAGATDTVTVNLTSGSTGAWAGNLEVVSGITKDTSGGYTEFELTTATLFGAATNSRQVQVEVMQIADNDPSLSTPAYSTVYPQVSRSTNALIQIKFKGTVADDKYYVSLSHAGSN